MQAAAIHSKNHSRSRDRGDGLFEIARQEFNSGIRRQEPAEVEEQETLLDLYKRALGM